MKIAWIVDALEYDAAGSPTSSLASYRYRVLFPATALRNLGHAVDVLAVSELPSYQKQPDAIIVGKHLRGPSQSKFNLESSQILSFVERHQRGGTPILADFNDDHFDDPVSGGYWKALLKMCDIAVCGSMQMQVRAAEMGAKNSIVIGDCLGSRFAAPRVYGPRQKSSIMQAAIRRIAPKFLAQSETLKLIWYGHPSNWPPMKQLLVKMCNAPWTHKTLIRILTSRHPEILTDIAKITEAAPHNLGIEFIEWSEEETQFAIEDSHVVLIPSTPNDSRAKVKTANRLIDGLHAGKFVIASPIDSYNQFQDFCWIGENLIEGLTYYLNHPIEARQKIAAGQEFVREKFSHDAIARLWEAAIPRIPKPVVQQPITQQPVAPDTTPVRLNLGCGDKILPDYINVDVAEARAGKKPDIQCNITDLSIFKTDYADEIMAIHVVEHFWRWEVLDILKEWTRVLKPGGLMILECPNLISACQTLLANPELASRPDAAGQRSMWVFYGDPGWKDPLMIHRWGYTPQSLSALMHEAGLINIRQEPAVYKLREPRDMRIVGEKPLP